jgi:hypothetical protein
VDHSENNHDGATGGDYRCITSETYVVVRETDDGPIVPSQIKQYVYEGVAVIADTYDPGGCAKKIVLTQEGSYLGQHFVVVVGWDDNYVHIVPFVKVPIHTPVWIVQNSWGPGCHDNGTYLLPQEGKYLIGNCAVTKVELSDAYWRARDLTPPVSMRLVAGAPGMGWPTTTTTTAFAQAIFGRVGHAYSHGGGALVSERARVETEQQHDVPLSVLCSP